MKKYYVQKTPNGFNYFSGVLIPIDQKESMKKNTIHIYANDAAEFDKILSSPTARKKLEIAFLEKMFLSCRKAKNFFYKKALHPYFYVRMDTWQAMQVIYGLNRRIADMKIQGVHSQRIKDITKLKDEIESIQKKAYKEWIKRRLSKNKKRSS